MHALLSVASSSHSARSVTATFVVCHVAYKTVRSFATNITSRHASCRLIAYHACAPLPSPVTILVT